MPAVTSSVRSGARVTSTFRPVEETSGSASRAAAPLPGHPTSSSASLLGRSAIQDMKAELEKIRRDTKALRNKEAQVKAKMKREEENHCRLEKERDEKERLEWRRNECAEMDLYCAEKKQQRQVEELKQRQDYQEHKRYLKEVQREKELEEAHEEYVQTKESAEYNAEMSRAKLAEEQRLPVEQNLEKYITTAAAKQLEREREESDQRDERDRREVSEMEHLMMLAQQERIAALESLEYVRFHEQAPVR